MNAVIDIGGTTTRIGFSSDNKSFENIERFSTPSSISELRANILNVFNAKGIDPEYIQVGVAGIINHKENRVVYAPNIDYFDGIACGLILPSTNAHVSLNNDTELAALGEYYYGAGKDSSVMAYISLSTGIGGSRVIQGKLDDVTFNYEPGHTVINKDGAEKERSGLLGTFEAYCSGSSFEMMHGSTTVENRDEVAWMVYAQDLAYGLLNVILMWSPDILVLGGGVANKHHMFLNNALNKLTEILPKHYPTPEVRISALGDQNGLLGGLAKISIS